MERRQIGLKLVMDCLGLSVKVGTFDDRLTLQKAVYLAQAAGVNLGYSYRWYLRGPYCPAVAEDGFAVSEDLAHGVDEAKNWALDEASATRLRGIRDIMAGHDLPRKLELFASVHFLISRRQVRPSNPEEIGQTLRRFGKNFSAEEIAGATGELKAHAILS